MGCGAAPRLARADEQGAGPGSPIAPAGLIPTPGGGEQITTLATPLVVYIDDLSSGTGVIFVGEQEVRFDNPGLVQGLQTAMA